MISKQIGLVYRKEMVDTLRDRRTLISMIVVPMVVIPGLILGMGRTIRKVIEGARSEQLSVMVLGEQNAPSLAGAIMRAEGIRIVPPDTAFAKLIEDKKLRAAVEFPPEFEAAVSAGSEPAAPTVRVYYHKNNPRSEFALSRIEKVLEAYRMELVTERLAASDLTARDLQPFQQSENNVASEQRASGEAFGGFIPYIIILLTMMGAMYPAIDVTAGEKERGTIETILASPVSRTSLALGKFYAVLTAAIATALLALGSLAISSRIAASDAEGGFSMLQVPLGAANAGAMLLMVVPVAVLFSGTLLAVALMAKTYKEAQSYISPLNIIVIIPAISAIFPGVELDLRLSLIPILNVSLASKQVIAGIFEWKWIGVIFASSCVYASIALAVAVSFFKRESVLFRT